MEKTVYPRKANYYETDMMGVVHHSNHIRYFEESRIFFMRNIGCDVMEMEQKGIIIPNVDAYGRYFKPIRFGDEVEIEVRLTKFTGAVMEYHYTARLKDMMEYHYTARLKDSGEIAATGHTQHCFVDKDFKPMSLRRKFPEYYARIKENISEE